MIKFKNTDIAIGISTFLRDDSLITLISSILNYLPDFKIYIVDQGVLSPHKKILYDGLADNGHIIKFIPNDSGISYSRQMLKNLCNEQYLVYMQDDFEVTENTNLYKMKEVLDENPDIGIVGGNLCGHQNTGAYSHFFEKLNDIMCYFPLDYLAEKHLINWHTTTNNIKFIYTDILSDFTMWRKKVPNIFDINVKTIEHTHTYLLVKYKTNYKVAFCPDTEIKHNHNKTNEAYNIFRNRNEDIDYIKKYWNISDFHRFTKTELFELENPIKNVVETKQMKPAPIKISEPHIKPIIEPAQIIESNLPASLSVSEFISKLLNTRIDFWLLKDSCLECVICKNLKTNLLYLGTNTLENMNKIQEIADQCNVSVNISVEQRKIKTFTLNKLSICVPIPVVQYLFDVFGKDNLINKYGKEWIKK
jgi:hypothetical protein